MRFTLIFALVILPFLLSAQTELELEQQLQEGVAAYFDLEFEEGELILANVIQSSGFEQDPLLTAKAHCFLGECQYELSKEEEYLKNLLRADQVLADAQIRTDTLDFYYRILLAKAIFPDDYADKAAPYQAIVAWAASYPNPGLKIKGIGLYAQGMANYFLENYDQSFRDFKESLKIQKPLGHDPFLGADHSALANLAASFEDYYLAITHQKICLELTSTKRPTNYFRNLTNLAGYQLDNRSMADARKTINQAKEFGRQNVADDSEFWMLYYNCQREYFNTDLNLDSLVFYQQEANDFYNCFPWFKTSTYYHDHLNYQTGIAIRKNDFDSAGASVNQAFELFPYENTSFYRTLGTLFLRSKVEIANEEYAQGINSIQVLLSCYSSFECASLEPHYLFQESELKAEPIVIEYLKDKASYYNQWDRIDTTKNCLELSSKNIQLADSLISILKQKNNQPGLRKQVDEISRELRKIEIENHYRQYQRTRDIRFIELAINASEQVKHLIISELLHENILYKNFGLPETLIKKERAYSKQLAADLTRINRGGQIDSLDVLQSRIITARDLQRELREEIISNYPRFAGLRYLPEYMSLEKIRTEFIDDNEVLLHFLERDSLIYVVGISKEEEVFRRIRLATPLAETSPVLIRQMESASDSVMPLLRNLYQKILAPLEDFMGNNQLVIVPDAYLWHLPFSALITQDAPEGTPSSGQSYLIQEREIRHLFSLRVAYLKNVEVDLPVAPTKDLLSLSPFTESAHSHFDHLPLSKETEKLLKEVVGYWDGTYLSGQAANRDAFFKHAATARLLHIFSHAQLNEARPSESFVMLNPSGQGLKNSRLTALDVYNSRLIAKLTVLAACKTAGGKYDQGQGIANLARAFAHAGCKNLVVNLWESKEEAINSLLNTFYPEVLENEQAGSSALAIAQRKYIKDSRSTAHPGYWGMAIYIGEKEGLAGLNNAGRNFSWLLAISLMALVSFLLYFFYWK